MSTNEVAALSSAQLRVLTILGDGRWHDGSRTGEGEPVIGMPASMLMRLGLAERDHAAYRITPAGVQALAGVDKPSTNGARLIWPEELRSLKGKTARVCDAKRRADLRFDGCIGRIGRERTYGEPILALADPSGRIERVLPLTGPDAVIVETVTSWR